MKDLFASLDDVACAALEEGLTWGRSLIVTNATSEWVKSSAKQFLPRLWKLLRHVRVLSAREEHSHLEPQAWKRHTFARIVASGSNLVALGDSLVDIEAARACSNAALVKTVKFVEAPSPSQLVGELRRFTLELTGIIHGEASADYGLQQKNDLSAECASSWEVNKV